MNTKLSLLSLGLVLLGSSAVAQTAPGGGSTEAQTSLSYNLGVVSDYRFRGLSQSARRPALQGGLDYAHKSGFYLGAWGSTISWIKDTTNAPNTTHGPVEIDLYGGYKGSLFGPVSYDVGLLQYWYVGNNLKTVPGFANANTLEVYGALSAGPVSFKYSHSLTNLFGTVDSKSSGYADLSANFDLGKGWTLTPHIGHQRIANFTSYTDYSLTIAKDWDGWVFSAAVVGTNWEHKQGAPLTLPGSGTRDLGGTSLVLGVKKNF